MEIGRFKFSIQDTSNLTTSNVDDEEVDAAYDGQLLTHLGGVVSDMGLDEVVHGLNRKH